MYNFTFILNWVLRNLIFLKWLLEAEVDWFSIDAIGMKDDTAWYNTFIGTNFLFSLQFFASIFQAGKQRLEINQWIRVQIFLDYHPKGKLHFVAFVVCFLCLSYWILKGSYVLVDMPSGILAEWKWNIQPYVWFSGPFLSNWPCITFLKAQ